MSTKARPSVQPSRTQPLHKYLADAARVCVLYTPMAMWPRFDSHNIPYIGYHHRHPLSANDSCDEAEARDLLRADIVATSHMVQASLTREITEPQLAAAISFALSVSEQYWLQSDVRVRIDNGDAFRVDAHWRGWSYAGGIFEPLLYQRRKAELRLYFAGEHSHHEQRTGS